MQAERQVGGEVFLFGVGNPARTGFVPPKKIRVSGDAPHALAEKACRDILALHGHPEAHLDRGASVIFEEPVLRAGAARLKRSGLKGVLSDIGAASFV